jgi:hypothetical protein
MGIKSGNLNRSKIGFGNDISEKIRNLKYLNRGKSGGKRNC